MSQVNSIHQLIDGQWVKIGSMSSSRKSITKQFDDSFKTSISVKVCFCVVT